MSDQYWSSRLTVAAAVAARARIEKVFFMVIVYWDVLE
jgi:hypothetical protein